MTAMAMRADFVMPKLGLTMTEGRVAHWAMAPGAPFAAGDIVVVVETDKIAYDVEAPGTGSLDEILVPEGETVAVGTPIARWMRADGAASATGAAPAARRQPIAASQPAPSVGPGVPARAGIRIIATPYARRLARESGLDLTTLVPANSHRIKAADVEAALARRAEPERGAAAEAAPAQPHLRAGLQPGAGFAFYGAEVCVDRLLRLIEEIGEHTADRPSLTHFVVLAAARALEADGAIGLQHDGGVPRVLPPDAPRRLSAIVAADRAEAGAEARPIAITVSDAAGATLVGCAPDGCDATLGVGAPVRVFQPDADGRPVLRTEIRLVLGVSDAGALPKAAGVLASIRAFLESPLGLLAS